MFRHFVLLFSLSFAFSLGWLSRGLWQSDSPESVLDNSSFSQQNAALKESALKGSDPLNSHDFDSQANLHGSDPFNTNPAVYANTVPPLSKIKKLLESAEYTEAISLYQEQNQFGADNVAQLRSLLLKELDQLLAARDYTRFSELTDAYLSAYYDDIDVLLLLADFNQNSGFFIEAVNVYQLIKTYAYSAERQQLWLSRFDQFVNEVDQYYTSQADWFALTGLYAHMEVLGLLSAPYQYKQAIAYLNGGDEYSAIQRLKLLVNDAEIGTQAQTTLNSLTEQNIATTQPQNNGFQNAKHVALQQLGNQFLVDLGINQRDKVTLLIDTGASMTTLSRAAFDSISNTRRVRKIGTRLFQTANGVTKGSVYKVEQLSLGSFQLNNMNIAVLDFTLSPGVDGLLGMNVLGQFRFQLDHEKGNLLLSK